MKLFEWNPEFDVGVDSVNSEHQHLIDLINDLSDAMKNGLSKEGIGEILDNLITYGYFDAGPVHLHHSYVQFRADQY